MKNIKPMKINKEPKTTEKQKITEEPKTTEKQKITEELKISEIKNEAKNWVHMTKIAYTWICISCLMMILSAYVKNMLMLIISSLTCLIVMYVYDKKDSIQENKINNLTNK